MADLTTQLSKFLQDLWAGTIGTYVPLSTVKLTGTSGQVLTTTYATASKTTNSGAGTETQAAIIPAGSLVLGVTVRNTTAVSGAGLGSYSIGDGTDADRWGAAIALAVNTTTTIANFTIASPVYYAAATNVVLTANAGQFDAGVVRITVHYISLTAATS